MLTIENEDFHLRKARLADADAVAEVARRSRKHFLPYLPDLHTLEEDKAFFRAVVLKHNDVWLAEVACPRMSAKSLAPRF
jgi:hypothetical protein